MTVLRRTADPLDRTPVIAALLVVSLVVAGCSAGDGAASATRDPRSGSRHALRGNVTVSAAASLKEAFTEVAKDFEAVNPGVVVSINFGSSADLATQIDSGAPADVVAFAAESDMTSLEDAHLLSGTPEVFATNELVIVTKPGNPDKVDGLTGLAAVAASGGTVSLCAEAAPCGRYATQVLQAAGVAIPTGRITRGQDVRATLAAVADGDADGGIVYLTDARAAGSEVATVTIPAALNAVARYPIAVVESTTNAAASTAFMRFVLGDTAQSVLRHAGFGAP
ncbi:MAG: molybdate ABC transporter substrate-binding protein [Actinobacteria bacterium]|nr:molybdate ABC transporter substrate-binding protein [Actinomycetota bacterium]